VEADSRSRVCEQLRPGLAKRLYIRLIEKEFGDLPLKALLDSEIRGEFKRWRRQNFKWN
jgi:hypothetical protein